ncbi:MAG TPA: hypothetical protein VG755_34740 [Nannocystaceae bacterium]|nr:hypothetical protein [Nannocystaceae bacterium]
MSTTKKTRTKQTKTLLACALTTAVAAAGCDRREELAPAKTKSLNELKQASAEKSDEELAKARKEAGWKSNEEVMAEAKEKYERDAKLYIKTRIADYRKLVDDIRKQVDSVEEAAVSWSSAKDPQAAITSFSARAKKDKTAVLARYNEITANGTEGGDTQVALADAVTAWGRLIGEPSAELAKSEGFKTMLAEVRAKLDEVSKTLDEIEKDATLVTTPDGAEGKPAEDAKKAG